jgi:hypothetical protein
VRSKERGLRGDWVDAFVRIRGVSEPREGQADRPDSHLRCCGVKGGGFGSGFGLTLLRFESSGDEASRSRESPSRGARHVYHEHPHEVGGASTALRRPTQARVGAVARWHLESGQAGFRSRCGATKPARPQGGLKQKQRGPPGPRRPVAGAEGAPGAGIFGGVAVGLSDARHGPQWAVEERGGRRRGTTEGVV